jgi:flagellar hook-basal body complex protein FliE
VAAPIIPISPIAAPGLTATAAPAAAAKPAEAQAFYESVARLVGSVDSSTAEANQAIGNMLNGTGDVHEAMIALQKAETALQMSVAVRN